MTQNKQKKIAVTGGIGSGKSTLCDIISSLGYPVISFDKVYAQLLSSGALNEKLYKAFGDAEVNLIDKSTGKVDRSALARVAFSSEDNTKKLNEITHPEIFKSAFSVGESYSGLCFYEVPLLFEGNYQNLFDGVVVVMRSEKERIASVMARSNLSEVEVKARINSQFDYNTLDFTKYYVIHNDGNLSDLRGKVVKTLAELL